MRVPRIGGIYTPVLRKNNTNMYYKKLIDPPKPEEPPRKMPSFGSSVAYYIKKYNNLPPEIQKTLTPNDAIDLFKDMEYVANGVVKRKTIGQGAEAKVYENPWLEGYHFIVLNSPKDADLSSEVIYSKMNHLGDAVWCDNDDSRIQLLTS